MKKIAVIFVALAAISSNHLSAQDRGDMFISASLSGATGSTSNVIRSGALSSTTSDLYSPSFGASLEFGAFLVNNLKTAICIGYEYDADKYYSDNSVYTATDNLVYLNPNVAYYVRLSDRLFYAPEIGASFGIGVRSEPIDVSMNYNFDLSMYSVYLQPLAIEARATNHIAIGASLCNLSFMSLTVEDRESKDTYTTRTTSARLSSSAWLRFYF